MIAFSCSTPLLKTDRHLPFTVLCGHQSTVQGCSSSSNKVSSTQLCWRTEGFQSVLSALGIYLLSVNTVLLSLRTQQPNFFPLLQNYWFCYDVYFYKKENRIMKITTRSDWPLVPPEQGSLRHKSCWADLQFCTQKEHEIKPQNELLR